jgi:nitrogen-specific signal transduction histidine kinase/CheY-like chemotaxis protein
MMDSKGSIIGAMGVATDITRYRKLEEGLLQAEKMESLGHLAAGMAHDVNNILGIILGNSDVMHMKVKSGNYSIEEVTKAFETISGAVNRGGDLIKRILRFAKKDRYIPIDADPNSVATEVARLFSEGLAATKHNISTDLRAKSWIHVDTSQVHSVLDNLVVNAREAMPNGGDIVLSSHDADMPEYIGRFNRIPAGKYVVLSVSDKGTGITEDVMNKMFEPLYTTKEKGTGLGLANVWGIIRNHNAYIDIKTELGKGSTFEVYLSAIGTDTKTEKIGYKGGMGNVLVIEDEEMLSFLIVDVLRSLHFNVETAVTTEQATKRLEHFAPDLVLSDLVLKSNDSSNLLMRIKEKYPKSKIVLMSGHMKPSDKEPFMQYVDDYLQKPFPVSLLYEAVDKAMKS